MSRGWNAERTGAWARALRILVAIASLYAVPPLAAEDAPPLILDTRATTGGVTLWAAPRDGPESWFQRRRVLLSLQEGHRSQIVLQVRLFRRAEGLARLLGDPLLREVVITRVLRPEPIAGRYALDETVDQLSREPVTAPRAETLLDRFFALEVVLPLGENQEGLYLRARYRLSPIRVPPQLGLLALVTDLGERSSAWTEKDGLGP